MVLGHPSLHQRDVIEILLSSAVCVTQKWDVSLPQQSVSVTALTPGWDSGHILSLAPVPLHPSPPTCHLVRRWSPHR